MKGYVFISNSTKPIAEKAKSREPVNPSNVSRPCLKAALALGYEVFLGTNRDKPEELSCDLPVKLFDSHTYRSLKAVKDNLIAIKNLSEVLKNNDIEVIHCNTPIAGIVARICAVRYRTKYVIYTAHGFNFYKGGPFVKNSIIMAAERIMARFTDATITMNQEDYSAANRFKMRNGGKAYFVHGVGINTEMYGRDSIIREKKRAEMGCKKDEIALISAGDLVKRKNYRVAIKAVSLTKNTSIHYYICGIGPECASLKAYAKELGIANQVHFLGFRTDMRDILKAADIFIFSSTLEGLPRSTMEAMASGLPCVVSRIRGNVDLIKNGINGYTCSVNDAYEYSEKIKKLAGDYDLRMKMGNRNIDEVKKYDVTVVEKEILKIYKDILKR